MAVGCHPRLTFHLFASAYSTQRSLLYLVAESEITVRLMTLVEATFSPVYRSVPFILAQGTSPLEGFYDPASFLNNYLLKRFAVKRLILACTDL